MKQNRSRIFVSSLTATFLFVATAASFGQSAPAPVTSPFTSGLDGWTFWNDAHSGETHTYTLAQDAGDGSVAAPCAKIAGDYDLNNTSGAAHAHKFGMQRTFTATGSNVAVSLKFKASSGWPFGSVTNGYITILNSSGTVLHQGTLMSGGWSTGWRSHATSSVPVTGSSITVRIYLVDAWSNNWNQVLKVDDVGVAFTGAPPATQPPTTPPPTTSGVTATSQQWELASQTQITEGASISTPRVRLSVNAASTGTETLLEAQFEVRAADKAFTGAVTHTAALSGQSGVGFVDVELANGTYHWQARVKTNKGLSAWKPFGAANASDFAVNVPGVAGAPTTPDATPPPAGGSSKKRCGLLGLEAVLAVLGIALLRRRAL